MRIVLFVLNYIPKVKLRKRCKREIYKETRKYSITPNLLQLYTCWNTSKRTTRVTTTKKNGW